MPLKTEYCTRTMLSKQLLNVSELDGASQELGRLESPVDSTASSPMFRITIAHAPSSDTTADVTISWACAPLVSFPELAMVAMTTLTRHLLVV